MYIIYYKMHKYINDLLQEVGGLMEINILG